MGYEHVQLWQYNNEALMSLQLAKARRLVGVDLQSCSLHTLVGYLHVLEQQGLQQAAGMQLRQHVWSGHRSIPQQCHPSRLQMHLYFYLQISAYLWSCSSSAV